MEMGRNDQDNDYRELLLSALRSTRDLRKGIEGGSLQVFVDQENIGALDRAGAGATLVFESRERPLHLVEVRTESGRLVGGLCMPESGAKSVRFGIGAANIELSAYTDHGRGTVRAVSCSAHPVLHRIQRMLGSLAGGILHHIRTFHAPARGSVAGASAPTPHAVLWARAGVLAQVVLAISVLALVTDRVTDSQRWGRVAVDGDLLNRQLTAAQDALARQEQRLAQVVRSQDEVERALLAQKRKIAGLHRVAKNVERYGRSHQEYETFFLAQLNDAAAERTQIHDRLRNLSVSNEKLSREVAQLQVRTVVTEARLANQAQSFQFWVSFQEGIPDERIDQWVREIRGHKGPVNGGWYSVEVDLPQSQSKDRLLKAFEQETDIVKAVSLSLDVPLSPK
ncbi:MAG TPA: hypothetical protein VGA17_06895 [Nitrospiraceae bacterium]